MSFYTYPERFSRDWSADIGSRSRFSLLDYLLMSIITFPRVFLSVSRLVFVLWLIFWRICLFKFAGQGYIERTFRDERKTKNEVRRKNRMKREKWERAKIEITKIWKNLCLYYLHTKFTVVFSLNNIFNCKHPLSTSNKVYNGLFT